MDEPGQRFRLLFDACYQPLLAYARRRASSADADDLVAEVLTTAWRRLDDIPPGAELPWLYGVARRLLANQRRGNVRRLHLFDRLTGERPPPRETSTPPLEILHVLERLRPADREVLRLAAWEELNPAEIAVVLGCTANAAALRLSRARRRLRDELTEMGAIRTTPRRKVTDA